MKFYNFLFAAFTLTIFTTSANAYEEKYKISSIHIYGRDVELISYNAFKDELENVLPFQIKRSFHPPFWTSQKSQHDLENVTISNLIVSTGFSLTESSEYSKVRPEFVKEMRKYISFEVKFPGDSEGQLFTGYFTVIYSKDSSETGEAFLVVDQYFPSKKLIN